MYNTYIKLGRRLGLLFTILLMVGLAFACEGVETELVIVPEPTDTSVPMSTPEPTDTPAPTDTPEPTDTPTPTDTPEPTPIPTPQVVSIDPQSFALTLDDLPSGFSVSQELQYSESYSVIFENEINPADITAGEIIMVANVTSVFPSLDIASEYFGSDDFLSLLGLGLADRRQISAPKLGDESIAVVAWTESAGYEFVAHTISWRTKNVIAEVTTVSFEIGSADTAIKLASIVGGKLRKALEESE